MAGGGPLLPWRQHGPTVPGNSGDAIKHFTRHQFVQIRTEPSICSDSGEECSADRGFRHWFLDPEARENAFSCLMRSASLRLWRPWIPTTKKTTKKQFGGRHRGARVAARGGDGRRRHAPQRPVRKHTRVYCTNSNYDAVSFCVCVLRVSVQRLVQRRLRQLATASRCAYLFFHIVCFLCF